MPVSPEWPSREDAIAEAITLLLDTPYMPRLVFILAALGANADASALLALQGRVLATLTARPGRRKPMSVPVDQVGG